MAKATELNLMASRILIPCCFTRGYDLNDDSAQEYTFRLALMKPARCPHAAGRAGPGQPALPNKSGRVQKRLYRQRQLSNNHPLYRLKSFLINMKFRWKCFYEQDDV